MNKKVSELTETPQIHDNNIVMILQGGENKQAKVSALLPRKQFSRTISNPISANTDYSLQYNYKVRQQFTRGILLWF